MNIKVWVTGSRGAVGSILVKALEKHNFAVTRISNSAVNEEGVLHVDYGSKESINSAIRLSGGIPDVIFHLGWGNVYEPQSEVHLGRNLLDTKNLIAELYRNGLKKFIMIGSSSEYGSRSGCLLETELPVGWITNYARGKIEACRYGIEVANKHSSIFVHVRLFHVLGVSQRKNSLINQLYRNYCDSTVLNLTSCEQFRDYIYVDDAINGLVKISEINSSEIINLGSGSQIQLKKFIKIFWETLGGSSDFLIFGAHKRPDDEPTQPPCYASLDKLRTLTNWQPSISIEEGIFRIANKFKGACELEECVDA